MLEEDSVFGLIEHNARFYSPTLGRFIQPDTLIPDLTNSQAWNRYAYVLNSPIMYVDPSGRWPDGPGDDHAPCPDGDCSIFDEIKEGLEDNTTKEANPGQPGFPKCSGPVCIKSEHFYALYFMPGDDFIPITMFGMNLDYGINLQMEYKSSFEIQAVWYEIQIDEIFDAWIGGGHEGAIFTDLIVDYESGNRNSYYFGKIDVNDSCSGSKSHLPIRIPVTVGPFRDEIRRLTIRITMVIWGNMGVVKALGHKAEHYYEVSIIVGPNVQRGVE